MKIEQLLGLSADSQSFGKINDLLSAQVSSVNERYFSSSVLSSMALLRESELQMVAGGQNGRNGEDNIRPGE